MNKLILFNEPVQSVRKSQQTIHSRTGNDPIAAVLESKLTDSNDQFRASLSVNWTHEVKNREILWARATDAVKSTLLLSNCRINYCNWK